jgi:hypothetical protein
MHLRKEIKAKVKGYLSGNTAAGTNVFANRFLPIDAENEDADIPLPAILVYCGSEIVEERDSGTQTRKAQVFVECMVKGVEADETLDDLVTVVEDILSLHGNLNEILGIDGTFFLKKGELGSDENKSSIIAWRMTYEATYAAEYPDSESVDLETVHSVIEHSDKTVFVDEVEIS